MARVHHVNRDNQSVNYVIYNALLVMLALKVIAPLVFEVGSGMFRRDTGKGDGDNDDSEANVIGGDNIVNMMIWCDLQ